MVLICHLAFLDPPKESAAEAIRQLHEAGVEVKVLSCDNDAVVSTIAKQVGIAPNQLSRGGETTPPKLVCGNEFSPRGVRGGYCVTGPPFEQMTDEEKRIAVRDNCIYLYPQRLTYNPPCVL